MGPLCSIVISSYNKAQYVTAAVDSALAQTYDQVEVIVVDDGSKDASLEVLRAYGDRIVLQSKGNGGQASALNQGFRLSRGEIILFLDCDDLLYPDTVERIVKAWTPRLSKIHFRLQVIDAEGVGVDGKMLPPYCPLPSGDVSKTFFRFAFYPAPPTSGNAFSRRFLEQVMPIPEEVYRAWIDTVLVGTAPLFGEIGALEGVGGSWRQSDSNYSSDYGLDKLKAKLSSDDEYIKLVRQHACPGTLPERFAARWPLYLKDRLIVAKFSRNGDAGKMNVLPIVWSYLQTVLRWPEYDFGTRLKFMMWAAVVATVPARLLKTVPGIAGPNVRLS